MSVRDNNVLMAKETLNIINSGKLIIPRVGVLDISKELKYSRENTYFISHPVLFPREYDKDGIIEIIGCSSTKAIMNYKKEDTAVLNFASAKHPGGGFKTGAMAQEESLAYSSTLYNSLLKFDKEFYQENLKDLRDGLYTDNMIMSQSVLFFRNDEYKICNPYYCDVLTSCAVNAGTALRRGISEETINRVMDNRIKNILIELASNDYDCIILGAFGCGVFRNDPQIIAEIFRKYLIDEKMRYYFDNIVFAIPNGGNDNFNIFKDIFK